MHREQSPIDAPTSVMAHHDLMTIESCFTVVIIYSPIPESTRPKRPLNQKAFESQPERTPKPFESHPEALRIAPEARPKHARCTPDARPKPFESPTRSPSNRTRSATRSPLNRTPYARARRRNGVHWCTVCIGCSMCIRCPQHPHTPRATGRC
jgi:hypothetical protein